MNFEFFRLANVEENSVVTEDTYSLVVNGDDVQKTKNSLIRSKFYKDFTDDYIEWRDQQQPTQRKDIETFVKTLITTDGVPYKGYIESLTEGTALFEVAGNNTNSKQHLEVFYEATIDGQLSKCIDVCDFYNSNTVSSNTYRIVGSNIQHIDNSDYFKSKNIINNGTLENNGNVILKNNLKVDKNTEIDGTLIVNSNSNNSIIGINGYSINLHGQDSEIYLEYLNDENLTLSGNNDSPIEIRGVLAPTVGTAAANKNYVDNKNSELSFDINNRINQIISGGLSEAYDACSIVKVDMDTPTSQTPSTSTFTYDVVGYNISNKVEFLSAYYNLDIDDSFDRRLDAIVTTGPIDSDTYRMTAIVPYGSGSQSSVRHMWFIYLIPNSNINIPELADLRIPYDYSGEIEDYSVSTQYGEGDYCWYPDSSTGKLYICIDQTWGNWDSTCWAPAVARTSISDAFNNRLLKNGSIPMTGNLNLNGTNKIINLATPTSGTDAANKNYVDDAIATAIIDVPTDPEFTSVTINSINGADDAFVRMITTKDTDGQDDVAVLYVDGFNGQQENAFRLRNLELPKQEDDAANKQYVDSKGFNLDANGILNFG